MRAGRLRHRLAIQSKSVARDSLGAAIITWADVATVWGAIEPLSGNEYFAQGQMQSESKVRIVIRYRSGVAPSMRIKHGGLYYDVLDVLNENTRDRQLILMCSEGQREDESNADVPANAIYDADGNPLTDADGNYLEFVD